MDYKAAEELLKRKIKEEEQAPSGVGSDKRITEAPSKGNVLDRFLSTAAPHAKVTFGARLPAALNFVKEAMSSQTTEESTKSQERRAELEATLPPSLSLSEDWRNAFEPEKIGEIVGGQLPQMAVSLGLPLLGGVVGSVGGPPGAIAGAAVGTSLGAAFNFALEGADIYQEALEKGASEEDAMDRAALGGLGNAALELSPWLRYLNKIPAIKLFGKLILKKALEKTEGQAVKLTGAEIGKRITKASRKALGQAAFESATEVVQEINSIYSVAQATGQPIDWGEATARMIESGYAGALLGGGVGALDVTREAYNVRREYKKQVADEEAQGIADRTRSDVEEAEQNAATQEEAFNILTGQVGLPKERGLPEPVVPKRTFRAEQEGIAEEIRSDRLLPPAPERRVPAERVIVSKEAKPGEIVQRATPPKNGVILEDFGGNIYLHGSKSQFSERVNALKAKLGELIKAGKDGDPKRVNLASLVPRKVGTWDSERKAWRFPKETRRYLVKEFGEELEIGLAQTARQGAPIEERGIGGKKRPGELSFQELSEMPLDEINQLRDDYVGKGKPASLKDIFREIVKNELVNERIVKPKNLEMFPGLAEEYDYVLRGESKWSEQRKPGDLDEEPAPVVEEKPKGTKRAQRLREHEGLVNKGKARKGKRGERTGGDLVEQPSPKRPRVSQKTPQAEAIEFELVEETKAPALKSRNAKVAAKKKAKAKTPAPAVGFKKGEKAKLGTADVEVIEQTDNYIKIKNLSTGNITTVKPDSITKPPAPIEFTVEEKEAVETPAKKPPAKKSRNAKVKAKREAEAAEAPVTTKKKTVTKPAAKESGVTDEEFEKNLENIIVVDSIKDISKNKEFGVKNKITTTKVRHEELQKEIKEYLKRASFGVDPKLFALIAEDTLYYIEGGTHKFIDYAKAMISEYGKGVIDYLHPCYDAARVMVKTTAGMEEAAKNMTPTEEIYKMMSAEKKRQESAAKAKPETPAKIIPEGKPEPKTPYVNVMLDKEFGNVLHISLPDGSKEVVIEQKPEDGKWYRKEDLDKDGDGAEPITTGRKRKALRIIANELGVKKIVYAARDTSRKELQKQRRAQRRSDFNPVKLSEKSIGGTEAEAVASIVKLVEKKGVFPKGEVPKPRLIPAKDGSKIIEVRFGNPFDLEDRPAFSHLQGMKPPSRKQRWKYHAIWQNTNGDGEWYRVQAVRPKKVKFSKTRSRTGSLNIALHQAVTAIKYKEMEAKGETPAQKRAKEKTEQASKEELDEAAAQIAKNKAKKEEQIANDLKENRKKRAEEHDILLDETKKVKDLSKTEIIKLNAGEDIGKVSVKRVDEDVENNIIKKTLPEGADFKRLGAQLKGKMYEVSTEGVDARLYVWEETGGLAEVDEQGNKITPVPKWRCDAYLDKILGNTKGDAINNALKLLKYNAEEIKSRQEAEVAITPEEMEKAIKANYTAIHEILRVGEPPQESAAAVGATKNMIFALVKLGYTPKEIGSMSYDDMIAEIESRGGAEEKADLYKPTKREIAAGLRIESTIEKERGGLYPNERKYGRIYLSEQPSYQQDQMEVPKDKPRQSKHWHEAHWGTSRYVYAKELDPGKIHIIRFSDEAPPALQEIYKGRDVLEAASFDSYNAMIEFLRSKEGKGSRLKWDVEKRAIESIRTGANIHYEVKNAIEEVIKRIKLPEISEAYRTKWTQEAIINRQFSPEEEKSAGPATPEEIEEAAITKASRKSRRTERRISRFKEEPGIENQEMLDASEQEMNDNEDNTPELGDLNTGISVLPFQDVESRDIESMTYDEIMDRVIIPVKNMGEMEKQSAKKRSRC